MFWIIQCVEDNRAVMSTIRQPSAEVTPDSAATMTVGIARSLPAAAPVQAPAPPIRPGRVARGRSPLADGNQTPAFGPCWPFGDLEDRERRFPQAPVRAERLGDPVFRHGFSSQGRGEAEWRPRPPSECQDRPSITWRRNLVGSVPPWIVACRTGREPAVLRYRSAANRPIDPCQ